jgi:APA family basic amino acid/polyamine antiporter
MRATRLLGVPLLYAVASSTVGFSIYFSIGVVADRGLGLTPLIFLGAGLMFALTTMTYVEGGAMFLERGGSSTFARHAFNELVSFIAGWAILIDYLIVIAAAAVSTAHYLTPISGSFSGGLAETTIAVGVIAIAVIFNIANFTGRAHQMGLLVLAFADLALQVAVIAVGAAVVFDPSLLTAQLDLFTSPSGRDVVYAAAVATIAFAGIEAASDLAPDLEFKPQDLRRVLTTATVLVPLLYAGMAAIALMAVPVVPGPDGPHTALGGRFIEEPVLGVVQSFHPEGLAEAMRWAVVALAVPILIWAANTSMLGLSRHVYVLATNRQIPSWLGKLERTYSTPYVAILGAGAIAAGLAATGDIRFLAGVYAFGSLLAITIAHVSIIRLRLIDPDRERPYRVPLEISIAGRRLPAPTIFAALISSLGWISVVAFHGRALWVGGGWMLVGLASYFVYRRFLEKTPLTKRVSVPELALKKATPEAEYSAILVPVFGTRLDDDIVGTAGRLADAELEENETPPRLEVVYVAEVPLTVPLESPLPHEVSERAERALDRAREVGDEYENVDVITAILRARSTGAGIVDEARRRGAELIVMGAEPPSKVRGGAILGGIGAARPEEIGRVTEYVLRKAPCRVVLTAPPEEAPGEKGAGAPMPEEGSAGSN